MPASGDESKGYANELHMNVGAVSFCTRIMDLTLIMHESIPRNVIPFVLFMPIKEDRGLCTPALFIKWRECVAGSYVST